MSAALQPLLPADGDSLHARLLALVRPELCGEVLGIEPDDPMLGRDRCGVACRCPRAAAAGGLCRAHYERWRRSGRPDPAVFKATTGPITPRRGFATFFDLRGLAPQARLELAYVVQCRQDGRAGTLVPSALRRVVALLVDAGVDSLLDRPLADWLTDVAASGDHTQHITGLVRYAWRVLCDLAEGSDPEAEFARDVWRADVLGLPVLRHPKQIRFDGIAQPWLRAAVKRWARFRLGAGTTFATVYNDAGALCWFSRFLAEQHADIGGPAGLTRAVLEHYLSWLATAALANSTRTAYLVSLRVFLEACRRHDWLPRLPARATLYADELPRVLRPIPRFVPEFVMSQLEHPDSLARLPDETTRNLVVVLIESGLRANDACALPFNPVIDDSVGWPCLRFLNAKMAEEQLVPLSPRAADAIRAQQAHLRSRWPERPPARLFPCLQRNPDGSRPFVYGTLHDRLVRWQQTIDLRDEAGQAVRVSPHQFRHTLGTRLINTGVPQHLVQRLLGHASPEMTARYAHIHDSTLRAAFDDYHQRRVDIHGTRLDSDPVAPTADAEWVKHNLARVQASLPNGYCGRPPQQDCPHPNACLTCPDFQTTPAFLPIHRRQRDGTLALIDAAEAAGNTRLAGNHRQVHANLDRVIAALEVIEHEEPTDAAG